MNPRIALIGCCLVSLAAVAQAGDKVDKTLEADADGVVSIENVRGQIDVSGWDRQEVHVEGELDDLTESFVFERDGKRTRIEVQLPDDNVDSGDGSTLTIRVPGASRIEVRGVSSDTKVKDVTGGIEIKSVSGDITATGTGGDLVVKTVSGDVRLESVAAGSSAQLKSVSGDMKLKLMSRDVQLGTVSGDVGVELGEFDKLGVSTVSGDLDVSGTLSHNGRVECKTVSGDCALRIDGRIDARISVRTGPGGEIVNHLNDTAPTEEFPAQQRLDTTIGNGAGSITASTVSGDITLSGD